MPATGSATGPDTTAPDTESLCRAYLATQDKQAGKKLEAASFELLADDAGGADKVLVYCQDLLQEDAKFKEGKRKTPRTTRASPGPRWPTAQHRWQPGPDRATQHANIPLIVPSAAVTRSQPSAVLPDVDIRPGDGQHARHDEVDSW